MKGGIYMFSVYITDKVTHEQSILESNLTEEQAESICEEWGWTYDDGHRSYWMGYDDKED